MKDREKLFLKRYPGRSFPKYSCISGGHADRLKSKLLSMFGISEHGDNDGLLKTLVGKADLLKKEIDESGFLLSKVLDSEKVQHTSRILINYMDFSEIYELSLEDIDRHFDDIYFPTADAIEFFDETCAWFVHVSYDRDLFLAKS